MELSEAHRTIDATAGFLMHLQALDNANLLVVEDEENGLGILEAKVYTTINTPYPERRCKFKYKNGEDIEFIIPQIAPVCDFIIDNWPSPSAKKLRSHIDESNVLYLADEILGLDDPMMYETVPEAYEYHALFRNGPTKLLDEIYDINYRLAYALRMTYEDETNEDESDDIISSSDELIIKAVEIMKKEKVIKNLYDYAFIMQIMNETNELPTFSSPKSFLNYFKELKITGLPGEDSIKKKVNATFGNHPSWTFTDKKGKDSNEAKRRIAIGSRFLSIYRKGK